MIAENINRLNTEIGGKARLIAVSKTKPVSMLEEAYQAGQRIFGENKALEMRDKHLALPQDIEWHFIGHLQTNKIKYIADFVSLIHSVDSENLLLALQKEARKKSRNLNILFQFYIATEETKYGFSWEECRQVLEKGILEQCPNLQVKGVMGVASNTEDQEQIRREFRQLKSYFDVLKSSYFKDKTDFTEISMGMSADYTIALEEGATLLRLGSSIFGARDYSNSTPVLG